MVLPHFSAVFAAFLCLGLAMIFLLGFPESTGAAMLPRNIVDAGITLLVTTLGMNISFVNGNDEISWKLENTMKKQCDTKNNLVQQCTIKVLT